ncbi:MAG: putative toxin-antitoxin system toxin component, PIN family [Gammaproteobacteria bacterium]|nr:putative toxin-antitoxin system toxin component, PIN family [Gammaproteobacteria bacterium]
MDTNVLVSGLLSPHGLPATVVDLVGSGAHRVCFDGRVLAEYRDVLTRPRLSLPLDGVETVLARLSTNGLRLAATPLDTTLPDPGDQPFLEVAVAAKVDYLITGNLKHFPPELCHGIAVVSPREFLAAIRDGASSRQGFLVGQVVVPDDFDRMGESEIQDMFTDEP